MRIRKLLFLLMLASMPAYALNSAHVQLLINASSSSSQIYWPGGIGVFSAVGTFGGATVTLEFLGPDGSTLIVAGTATTLTSAGAGVFYLHPCNIEAVISGGSPSGIYAAADRVPQ